MSVQQNSKLCFMAKLREYRDVKQWWLKCGWNDSSNSFHVISVTSLDPIAAGKELEFFLNF